LIIDLLYLIVKATKMRKIIGMMHMELLGILPKSLGIKLTAG
jgi:hypothetical protein